ncbi:Ig-like domain-containing protein [Flavobacterium sp. DG1-102-2]|uniref:Ig-like domain-containing protein n=1 Tax=Flavobacterium sp. DG1-102-2 TaxID=3081663 RepID=UPI002949E4AA|nr:Ig-like domain-containing protein [Flavobacterium sp. DG1-102-2]MDV6169486.1 Ig-like domain-containing protein [Flavobacterium sp. DG1-102-2]
MSNNYFTFKITTTALLLLFVFNLSAQECAQPAAIFTAGKGMHYAKISWTGLQTQPELGYDWQLSLSGSATIVQQGTAGSATVVVTGLTEESAYQFKVRTHCSDAVYSDWAVQNFTTLSLNSTYDGVIGSGADAFALFGASYGPLMYAGIAQRNGSVANMLYTQNEMQSINIPNGANITGVAFEKINNAVGGDAYPDLRLRMFARNSSTIAPLDMTTTYGNILATHTEVTDNPAFDLPATIGWIDFPFEEAFTYTGGAFEIATAMYQNGQTAQFSNFIVWQFTAGYKDYMIGAWPINTVPMNENLILNHNSGGGQYKDRPNIKIYFELSNAPLNLYINTPNAQDPVITQNGGSLQLFSSVVPSHVAQEVLWQITAGTENATISTTGLVTALANGTVTIQAVSAEDATVLNTITITISGQLAPVQNVAVTVADNLPATIATDNGTLQLAASVLPATANQNVAWSITTGSEYASVDANGLVTAIDNGTVSIQAVSIENAAILDTIDIVITNQVLAVASLEVSVTDNLPATITADNGTLQLSALVLPSNSNQNVAWSITAGSEYASIDANGLVTAIDNGTVTVQAVSAEDATIFDSIEVVITNQVVAVASLEVKVADDTGAVITTNGGTLQLEALVLPSNSVQDVTWQVLSGDTVVSVDANGLVTAITNGTATVQATSTDDDTVTDAIEITVTGQVLGLGDFTADTAVLYPNPAQTVIRLQSKFEIDTIEIYAVDGRKVMEGKGNNINVSALPQSNYILIAKTTEGTIITKKIVKN